MKLILLVISLFLCMVLNAQKKFSFNNSEATISIEYEIPTSDQEDIFELAFDWTHKYYAKPRVSVSEDLMNKKITVNGSMFRPFSKRPTNPKDMNTYESDYTLVIECQEKKYIIYYTHNEFTYNLKKVNFTLKTMHENSEIFQDWLKTYEINIENLLCSLNNYIKNQEMIY